MSSVFVAISLIKTVSGTSTLTGIATYRYDDDEFIDYRYKAFTSANNQHMINNIEANTTMLIIGRFVLENTQLDVTITQAILLDLKTIGELPSMYDLPPCPPFGHYTAPCKSSEINQNSTSYFTLEQKSYNPLTSNSLTAGIACSYNAGISRYAGVAKATESNSIISVSGELYKGKNMIQIITSDIEWNNIASTTNTSSPTEQTSSNSKKRNQGLMNYESRSRKRPNHKPATTIVEEENTVSISQQDQDSTEELGDETKNKPEEMVVDTRDTRANKLRSAKNTK